jgi:dolichyl-phosphate-mannose-protein mannosyltransferase
VETDLVTPDADADADKRSTGDPTWSWRDTVMLLAVTLSGAALRVVDLRRPRGVWDETVYIPDACLYVRGPRGGCGTLVEVSTVHPPLGKWLIGAGIRIFGNTPTGWRAAPLLAGVLSIAVLYLLARQLSGSTFVASAASGLLALDLLHFVLSRAAMLDIFVVFFGLVMFLCYAQDRRRVAGDRTGGLLAMFRRRAWLLAAGLAGGAAIASKWSGLYLLLVVASLVVVGEVRARRDRDGAERETFERGIALFVALIVLPLLVYALSYGGRLHGDLLAWPWSQSSWVRAFVDRQRDMFSHHRGELYVNPYTSPAWSWFFVKRPVAFDFVDLGNGRYQEVMALGNPLLWCAALIATGATAWRWIRSRFALTPESLIVSGFVAGYVPWLIVTRREAFIYYLLPALPFAYLALAQAIGRVRAIRLRQMFAGGVALVTLGGFAFSWPLLTGGTVSYDGWRKRVVFHDCGPRGADGRLRPFSAPVAPPQGWCWV